MADKPLVSVIVIFLNAARFLDEAIVSVVQQTHDQWQLLLVDDGSTDGSTEIAKRYADRAPARVQYLSHPDHQNRGMSASRNLGVKHARGDYIAFLDADDVWLPEKLERQVAIMQAQPQAQMVYGASQYWYSWTGDATDVERDHTPKLGVEAERLIMPPTMLTLSLRSIARTPCPSDLMVRRQAMLEVGGFEEHFRGKLSLFEDQAFLGKMFVKFPIFVTKECWDRYRRHPDSCVSVAARDGSKHAAGLMYFEWLETYLSAQGVEDPDLWSALRGKRFRYRHPRFWAVKSLVLGFAKRTLPASVRRYLQGR